MLGLDSEDLELVSDVTKSRWEARRKGLQERRDEFQQPLCEAERALGEAVFDLCESNPRLKEGCEDQFEAVNSIKAEIAICDAELSKLDDEIRAKVEELKEGQRQRQTAIESQSEAGKAEKDGDDPSEATCLRCGATLNSAAAFCMMCGANIEEMMRDAQPTEDEQDAAKFCSSCGSEIGPDDVFCMNCGTKL